MPTYRDKVTGQTASFDHEPSQQELESHFGAPTARPDAGLLTPSAEQDKTMVAPGLGGMLGGLIGGKTPLGKLGAGIGAAAGTGIGDLYNMFAHGVGDTTPSSEAQRLATVGATTAGLEVALPPILRGVGALKNILPKGLAGVAAPLAGYATGHTGLGIGAGAAMEAAPHVANGIDWLGTPAGTAAGNAAREAATAGMPAQMAARPAVQAQAAKMGDAARVKAGGPLAEVPDYLKQENWGSSLRSAGSKIKDTATSALEGLQGMFGGGSAPPPPAPPSPATRGLQLTKTPGDVAERLGVTGQPVSSQPDISRNPDMRWNADVSAAPQRTPQLSQTSPTDPQMPWEEHMARSVPKRTATGGANYTVDPRDAGVNFATKAEMDAAGPLPGLKAAQPGAASVGTHDEGLQRWLEGGGTPESYLRAKGPGAGGTDPNFSQRVGPEGFGPNTVGAAEKAKWLPKTVDEAKGLSLQEQEAWAGYKAANPGVTDNMLNSWYTSNQLGANPHEGMDINAMADKLTELLRTRKP